MNPVNPNKLGLVLGALYGGWHFLWAVLVGIGWAQAILNFVFWMHFVAPPFKIEAFQPGRALVLIFVTVGIGYLIGCVLGFLWNRINTRATI